MYMDEFAKWKYSDTMATHELIVEHHSDGIKIDLGDGEILSLDFPKITININGQDVSKIDCPPDLLKLFEGEIIGRSLTDLSLDRVAIVDWTVYSDNADEEQWTVLSWVIVHRHSTDYTKYYDEGIVIMANTQRLLEDSLNVNN
jgi:hypothetical protein